MNSLRRVSGVVGVGGLGMALGYLTVGEAAEGPGGAAVGRWKASAGVSVKESYDSNVYLQDLTPQARQSSWITTVMPALGIRGVLGEAGQVTAQYQLEQNWFHQETTEDHTLHRASLGWTGSTELWKWDWQGSLVAINGSEVGPTFTGPGGAPAAGGPQIRDRHDAVMVRSGWKATRDMGEWWVRPAASFYWHDFQTVHRSTPGYLNYVDRHEGTVGMDVGTGAGESREVAVGYRFGGQDQSQLLDYPEEYDNQFHRVLFQLEGRLAEGWKAGITLGPEFRRYGDKVPASFGKRDRVNLFVDGTITWTSVVAGTWTVTVKQFEQPAFGGRSTYEDLVYDLNWRRKLGERWTVGAGGRAYNTDFLEPAVRNDWVYSGTVLVACQLAKAWQAEASYTFEKGESQVPSTEGREYERQLVALGIRYRWE